MGSILFCFMKNKCVSSFLMSKSFSTNRTEFIWSLSGSQLLLCFTIRLVDTVGENQSGSTGKKCILCLQNVSPFHLTLSKESLMM